MVRPSLALRALPAAFPILLWFLATFFLLGRTGIWHDDWYFIQRVPETGAVRALVLDRSLHYWRPLCRVVDPALATLLWERVPLHHLIVAAAHGFNAWLLWRLLSRLGVRRLAAGLSAMFFLVFPWAGEVALWLCVLPTGLSVAVMLGAMHLIVSYARGRCGWWVPVACAALTFAACCFNEQPAMLLGAFPVLYVCAAPGLVDRRGAVRAVLPAVMAGVAAVAYAVVHSRVALGAMNIGGAHGVSPVSRWASDAAGVWAWVAEYVGSERWMVRAWEHAGMALGEHPWRAAAALVLLAGSAAAWAGRMARGGGEREGAGRAWALLLAGGAAVALPMVPIIITRYPGSPRILYASSMGLAVVLAAVMTWVADRRAAGMRARGLAAGIGAVVLAGLALAMVGEQDALARRARMDREMLDQITGLMPEPAPGSVVVPVRIEAPAHPPGAGVFENPYYCALSSVWDAPWAVRLAYRRSDVDAGHATWGGDALRFPAHDGARVEGVIGRVAWGRMVPVEVDGQNRVRLVTSVRFVNAAGQERVERVPQTAALADRGLIERREYDAGRAAP